MTLNICEPGKYLCNSLQGDLSVVVINCDLNNLATDGYTVVMEDGYATKHIPVKVYNTASTVGTGTFTVELEFHPIGKVSAFGQHLAVSGHNPLTINPVGPFCQSDGNHNFASFADTITSAAPANGRCLNFILKSGTSAAALTSGDRIQLMLVFTV